MSINVGTLIQLPCVIKHFSLAALSTTCLTPKTQAQHSPNLLFVSNTLHLLLHVAKHSKMQTQRCFTVSHASQEPHTPSNVRWKV